MQAIKYYSMINDNCYIRQFDQYDKRFVQLTHQLIPWNQFVEDFVHLNNENEIDQRDYCIIRLLEYFKNDLFSWVNELNCDNCNDKKCYLYECRRTNDFGVYNCQRIEIYKCPECDKILEFPRYNHAGRLLETRRGRCGEWALCFAYICHVFNYDVRMVNHFDDHVWVEVFSDHQKRWIHCDPCENAYDNPLLYECGWNKPATLIVAHGMNEIRDVTWRYSQEWRKTVALRRQLFDENYLQQLIDQTNYRLQYKLEPSVRDAILNRWLGELAEFLRTPDQDVRQPSDSKALRGRISGSIEWRKSRAESEHSYHEFHLDQCGRKITYDCQRDEYSITLVDSTETKLNTIKGWRSGCYESCHIFRMIEHDWQMCYLSRQRYCGEQDEGSIRWRFKLPDSSVQWNQIELLITGKTYESGVVELNVHLSSSSTIVPFNLNEKFRLNRSQFEDDVKHFDVEAKFMFGSGDIAWQHAQLFRQNLSELQNNQNNVNDQLFSVLIS